MTQYKISWTHFNLKPSDGKKKRISHAGSTCFIEVINPGQTSGVQATAYVHPKDNFDRKIGLYESFKKAVAHVERKDDRKALWNDFLSHRKPITSKSRLK